MKLGHCYFVYIVECSDGLYYTGVTNNIELRLRQHNSGVNPGCFTYTRRPVVLKYWQQFSDINNAIASEKQIKGWNRRKKEALFREDWDELKRLSAIRYGMLPEDQYSELPLSDSLLSP